MRAYGRLPIDFMAVRFRDSAVCSVFSRYFAGDSAIDFTNYSYSVERRVCHKKDWAIGSDYGP